MSIDQSTTSGQLYNELHSVIRRYTDESDLTMWQTIAALECVKADVLDGFKESQRDSKPEYGNDDE